MSPHFQIVVRGTCAIRVTTICSVNPPAPRENDTMLIGKKSLNFGTKIGIWHVKQGPLLCRIDLSKSPRNNDVPCFMFNFYAKYAICKRKCDSKFNLKSPSQTRSKTSYSLEKASIGLLTENCTIKQVLKLRCLSSRIQLLRAPSQVVAALVFILGNIIC